MVLCFTKFLLDEKRQLSKIWLAAHWEKKVKRSQIFEVDIERSVQDIMSPEIMLDLRISGHLLVGIVKIHSRKTKYLLTECNNIFYQVKIFRAGIIDLPDNKQTASTQDITIAEYFGDFQIPDNSIIETILVSNQCHIEDITLKETFGNLSLIDEDDMMKFTPAEEELVAFNDEDMLKLLNGEEPFSSIALKPKDFSQVLEKELEPESLYTNEESFYTEEMAYETYREKFAKKSVSSVLISIESFPDESNDSIGFDYNFKSSHELNLGLLESDSTTRSKNYKPSRKRKLLMDEIKTLSHEKIEKQVLNTSDIITVLDLAPTSKRSMTLKETGSVEQLFSLPALKVLNTKLLYLYKHNLKNFKNNFNFEESSESQERSYKLQRKSSELFENCRMNKTIVLEKSSILSPINNTIEGLQNGEVNISFNAVDICEQENFQYNVLENVKAIDQEAMESQYSFELQSNETGEVQKTQFSKTSEEIRESMLQRKMTQIVHNLKLLFQEHDTICFSSITENKRSLVAQKLSCLLVLKKFSVLSLEQSESYGEIYISPGENFISACYKI